MLDKWEEEAAELRAELPGMDPARLQDEVGDLCFVLANLARKLDLEPEACMRAANAKFERRFGQVDAGLAAEGRSPERIVVSNVAGGTFARLFALRRRELAGAAARLLAGVFFSPRRSSGFAHVILTRANAKGFHLRVGGC